MSFKVSSRSTFQIVECCAAAAETQQKPAVPAESEALHVVAQLVRSPSLDVPTEKPPVRVRGEERSIWREVQASRLTFVTDSQEPAVTCLEIVDSNLVVNLPPDIDQAFRDIASLRSNSANYRRVGSCTWPRWGDGIRIDPADCAIFQADDSGGIVILNEQETTLGIDVDSPHVRDADVDKYATALSSFR
jgi:hypothetical protein